MKKTLLFLGACLVSASIASAQWISGGPEIGLNVSNLSSDYNGTHSSSSMRAGLKVGGVLDIGITNMFSIQPGLYYSMKGAQQDYFRSTYHNTYTTTNETKYDYRIDYLEIPVNAEFKFGTRRTGWVFVGAGPYIGFALGGRATTTSGTAVTNNNGTVVSTDRGSSYNLQIGNNATTDDVRPLDAGFNVNAGYELPMGLFARVNYGQGLVNIVPGGDSNNSMRNWGFGFTLGYMFGH